MWLSRKLIIVSVVALCGISMPALADECADPRDQTTMNICAGKEFEAADKALNAAYREIVRRIGDDHETKTALTAAQRAWITFRDGECAFQTKSVEGGSIYPLIVADCKTALTEARTEQLKTYLDCEEGDMSCPVPPAD
ncbi:lysozyme inhibitor LprI family protein [Neoaquamicrobium sediminum]|uniref:lysozyme inhibitor LprI family protein n=2 Tax=Neoaquamicrobium sediminum TaxID=1849104 RepID=UPI0019D66C4D